MNNLGNCPKCGAPNAWSNKANKPYCSAKCWANNQPNNQAPTQPTQAKNVSLEIKDKPHSYEFGKAGNRFKVYYNDVQDLTEHLRALVQAGYCDDPTMPEIETQKFD